MNSAEVTPETGSWDFGETEVSYVFYVMYDKDWLYVAAKLTDNDIQIDSAAEGSIGGNTWQDDSIETFVDGNNNDALDAFAPAETPFGGQHVITANNAIRFTDGVKSFGDGPDDDFYAVADIKDDNHWEMEARLKLALFDSPQLGDTVGFDISTNDDDGGGSEEAALFWTGEPPDIYSHEAQSGIPGLEGYPLDPPLHTRYMRSGELSFEQQFRNTPYTPLIPLTPLTASSSI